VLRAEPIDTAPAEPNDTAPAEPNDIAPEPDVGCAIMADVSDTGPAGGFPDLDPQLVAGAERSPLRQRDFALLFAGQSVSVIGDRLVMVAMPFAVLATPGARLSSVGLVLGASALSLALFVLVGGVYGDRLPRHLTMLGSDLVRAASQGVSAGLLLTDHATVGRLVLLQVIYGAAEAFFRPAVLGLVPQLVPAEQIQPANALLGLASNGAMVLGPAAAGALVGGFGAGPAIAIDAATFAVSGLTLTLLRPRPVVPAGSGADTVNGDRGDGGSRDPRGGRRGFLTELAGGWREVRSRTWVWSVIVAFAGYHTLVLPALFVFGPVVSQQSRGGAVAWGVISGGFGVGAVLGSVLALRWRPERPGLVIGGSLCLSSAQAAIVVSSLPTAVVTGLELITGVTTAVCFTLWETAIQQRVDPTAQARVSSFDYLGSLALMPVGYLLMNPLGNAFGLRPAAVAASVVSLVLCVIVALSPGVRRLRRLPVVGASRA
jgi:MFS family permease